MWVILTKCKMGDTEVMSAWNPHFDGEITEEVVFNPNIRIIEINDTPDYSLGGIKHKHYAKTSSNDN